MSSLFRRENGVYYLTFYDATRKPSRKTVSTGETTRRKAEAAARRIEADVIAGRRELWPPVGSKPVSPDRTPLVTPTTPLADATGPFLAAKEHLAVTTQNDYDAVVRRFVRSLPEGLQSQQVMPDHVRSFIEGAGVKPVTRHTYRRHLRVFFRWLVGQGALAEDPTTSVPLERAPLKHPRFLTPEDVEALCQAVEAPYRYGPKEAGRWLIPVVRANVYLGLRLGEIVNLRWEHVDLGRRLLAVRCTEEFVTKAGRERTLPLSAVPYDILLGMERRGAYVFTNHGGKRLDRDHLSRTFKRYARRAGLSEEIDFHATRHTAASWLMMKGASIEAVRRYLGHSSISVTQRYVHLSADAFSEQITSALDGIR